MLVSDVKLKRVVELDKMYEGSKEVFYIFEGSKHLPRVKIRKHYYYNIIECNDDNEEMSGYLQGRNEYLRTLAHVKEWIADYDVIEDNRLAEERLAEEKRIEENNKRMESIQVCNNAFKLRIKNDYKFHVGQRLMSKFASLNKNCTLGEYLFECNQPKEDKEFGGEHWSIIKCEVEQICEISNELYDEFVEGLMDNELGHKIGYNGKGGTDSDFIIEDENKQFYNLSEHERNMWLKQSYRLVSVVSAPNRQPVLVDPRGYDYARYVGFITE